MPTAIKCPKCAHEFPLEEAVSEDYKKDLREKMEVFKKQKEEELSRKELEWKQEYQKKEAETKQQMEFQLRKDISTDYENRLKMLEQNKKENEERLKQAREKELEFLKKEQDLKNKEAELEITAQTKLQEERQSLIEELRRIEEQKTAAKDTEYQLKFRELEKQRDDQKRLVEEMKRKAEQGSTQLQGESQELLLEEMLRNAFPFDSVIEVLKGVEGADCILVVKNKQGAECGKIIFESKRTKSWQNVWIEKLKHDMRSQQADIAILVSQVYPKGMECFGEKDGVWIASFKEMIHLTAALRNAIIRIAETKVSEENKGEKMHMLYNYLTGIEFRQHIEAIVEGFMAMKQTITKERIQMEKMWKEREKQLDKVLLNTSGLYGSIKGIAGASVQDIPLLEASTNGEEEKEIDE